MLRICIEFIQQNAVLILTLFEMRRVYKICKKNTAICVHLNVAFVALARANHARAPLTPPPTFCKHTHTYTSMFIYIYTLGSPVLPPPAHRCTLPRLPRITAAASDGSGGPTTKVLVCCWLFAAVALCMLSHRVHVLFGSPQMFDILKVKREHNKRLYQTAAPGWINYCPCFMLCVIYALDENAPSCPFLLQ